MVIRKEQEDVLRRSRWEDFENRMFANAREFFPTQAADEEEARALVHRGVARAMGYGFVSERDICLFLNLLFSFGPDADTTKPWAAAILNYSLLPDPAQKAEWLQVSAEAYLED